jgi:hypothetical protein
MNESSFLNRRMNETSFLNRRMNESSFLNRRMNETSFLKKRTKSGVKDVKPRKRLTKSRRNFVQQKESLDNRRTISLCRYQLGVRFPYVVTN